MGMTPRLLWMFVVTCFSAGCSSQNPSDRETEAGGRGPSPAVSAGTSAGDAVAPPSVGGSTGAGGNLDRGEGGAAMGGADCEPTGTWTLAYMPTLMPGGGTSGRPVLVPEPDVLVLALEGAQWQADLGREARENECAGTGDGTFGTYQLKAEHSGACAFKITELGSYATCGEPYQVNRTLELSIAGDTGIGTLSDWSGCLCQPTHASFGARATRVP